MNLWIFGDSYSSSSADWAEGQAYGSQTIEKSWFEILAELLTVDKINLHSQKGVANEWIYSEIIKNQALFEKGDYVVIQLTSKNRKWFLIDHPSLSNIFNSEIQWNNKEQAKAIEGYKKHLHTDLLDIIHQDMMICALQYIAKTLEDNVKVLIVSGFDKIPGVTGSLGDICFGEFTDRSIQDKYYFHHRADPRINHMHEENHKVLAEKIYNFFDSFEHVDFTSGFKTKFINQINYKKVQQDY